MNGFLFKQEGSGGKPLNSGVVPPRTRCRDPKRAPLWTVAVRVRIWCEDPGRCQPQDTPLVAQGPWRPKKADDLYQNRRAGASKLPKRPLVDLAAKHGRNGPLRALHPVPVRLFGISKPHSPEPERSMGQASLSTGSRSHHLPRSTVAPVQNRPEAPRRVPIVLCTRRRLSIVQGWNILPESVNKMTLLVTSC